MAVYDKTTFWSFTTRLTNLATNTTLGTATRHDFAAITIDVPENTPEAVTFKSVKLRVTARDVFTTATDLDGWRLGIKLGGVAFDDVDYASAAANTGDHEEFILERDVTAYFVANFGSGASQTCQVGVAFQTGAASNVNNITAELWITYDYDNSIATQCKSVEIPIQGHHTSLPTTDTEIGTTGGVSNAAANQIPNLSTFCPEASKSFKQVYLRITANDAGIAATNFNLFVQIDSGGTEDTRATLDHTLITAVPYRDIVDLLASPHSMTTNAVHALICRSSLASTFENISAVLVVTYTFTVSGTTRELHTPRVPMDNDRSSMPGAFGATAGDDERFTLTLEVPEASPTLLQSGMVVYDQMMGVNGTTTAVYNSGQGVRVYAHANVNRSGPHVFVRRCDHDSTTWAIFEGHNVFTVDARSSGVGVASDISGYGLICYTADVPSTGIGSGNRSVCYAITSHPTSATGAVIISAPERVPTFPTSRWVMSGAFVDIGVRALTSTISINLQAERQSGEDSANGWYTAAFNHGNSTELGRREACRPITSWLRTRSFRTLGMDVLTTRRWRAAVGTGAANFEWCATLWLTMHSVTAVVAGTLTVDGNPGIDGNPIQLFAHDPGGNETAELVDEDVTVGGAFSMTVPLDDRVYFTSMVDVGGGTGFNTRSASDALTGSPDFDLVVNTTGGGGEVVPPTASATPPASNDYTIAKDTAVSIVVSDVSSPVGLVAISVKFSTSTKAETIYVGSGGALTGYMPGYRALSSISGSGLAGVGYTFSVRRDDSWPKGAAATFTVLATDSKGNILS